MGANRRGGLRESGEIQACNNAIALANPFSKDETLGAFATNDLFSGQHSLYRSVSGGAYWSKVGEYQERQG